ncbi:HAD family phosphatase [uncultured Limnohabitans sp.]|jgi:HAD superfamily hydrolase (TIGR01509 family)|uniref:HAD family hydrolase n=1 Tax=uncultured Limnohabitans sp. TaxID=768543 RepID=UPI0026130A9C|nr:HAD family phosphatase [uncultured Limnohabitans sp.]
MNFEAILFDCDGVLVDSEAITCGVLRDMFAEQGWRMTLAECMQRFVGHTVKSQRATIEAHTGQPLTDAWLEQFFSRRNERLTQSITAIEGVHEAVAHLHAHCQGSIAVASGADRFKVEMMLKQVGLIGFFEGRIFSGHEMPRSKPHPDVYLAAAAHLRVDPARCLVVEDTTVGITAGVAAGATVWAYAAPPAAHEPLVQAGAARVFTAMGDLRLV